MTTRMSRRHALRLGFAAAIGVGSSGIDVARVRAAERVVADVDRQRRLSAAFGSPTGTWQAGDVPHAYPLPDGRTFWLLNDSFLSPSINDVRTSTFVRNAAFLEDLAGVKLIESDRSFQNVDEVPLDRWWWFHGGIVVGSKLLVTTTEMVRVAPLGWEINFEPRSTWITTIDWRRSRILAMRPAPNTGVTPMYGFSIASDREWTYLFGNNHLYGRSTTENRVARVPYGQLFAKPTYWNGQSWTATAADAVSILTHGDYACRLNVFRHGSRWLGTAKDEEFRGTDALLFEAPLPTGPWTVIRRLSIPTKTGDSRTCTYDVMAQTLGPSSLLLWWSNNAYKEALFRSDPSVYRPTFMQLSIS